MAVLGLGLSAIGGLICLVGAIWMIVIAFQDSIGWGLGSLFCGIVLLVYVAKNFETTKQPFFIWLAGLGISIVGNLIASAGAAG